MDRFVAVYVFSYALKTKLLMQYMKPWGRVGGAHKATENEELRKQIWDYMEEQVKDFC